MFFFNKDTAALYGNIFINGSLAQETGSYLYFFGKKWINTKSATLVDESPTGFLNNGGVVNFQQPSTRYGDLGRQNIIGSYDAINLKGPSFASLALNNAAGLQLDDSSDLAVRRQLYLRNGNIYLNGSSLVIGTDINRGSIEGFTDKRYVVTGTQPMGGFIHFRSVNKSTDSLIFPIGSTDTSYTPMSVNNTGVTNHFKGRVFDKTFDQGLSGTDISHRSINKTWLLAAVDNPLQGSVALQHNIPEEPFIFFDNRDGAYVAHNINGSWDAGEIYGPPKNPGLLTTGAPITIAGTNTRIFANDPANTLYILTKLTKDTTHYQYPRELIDFTATRLSPVAARLDWHALFTNRIVRFDIQKRKTNELDWTTIGSVNATSEVGYTFPDNDVYYPDPIYYRLNVIYKIGVSKYSEVRSIPGVGNNFAIAYPNPTVGEFTVTVADYTQVASIGIYDYLGRKLEEQRVPGPNTRFNIHHYASGIYLVLIVSKDKKLITSLKVIKEN
ncbi:T9SS type A sorting domain-containing protein [Deminuibacter soli]|nr:T9SS type A sorting domain-containing protein [Deminuibacter soli]